MATRTRAAVIDDGFAAVQRWGLRIVIIGAAAYALGWLIGQTWVVWFPVVLALLLTTVLAPPATWLRERRVPSALAATIVMLGFLGIAAAAIGVLVPQVAEQVPDIADRSVDGLAEVRDWLIEGPLGLSDSQITRAIDAVQDKIRDSAEAISEGVFTTIGAATSAVVNFFVVLILAFLFIKDGHRFLPWLGDIADRKHSDHAVEVLARAWRTLGGFIRTQGIVAAIDGLIIGIGLAILGNPLALPLGVITFVGGFIPIIGALVSGVLAVLVTLVTNSPRDALIALIIVLAVQQLEGNFLSPMLQGKSMSLHPAVVLLSVMLGGSLFGVTGAFLAVPVAATAAEVFRYMDERIELKTRRKQPAVGFDDDEDDEPDVT